MLRKGLFSAGKLPKIIWNRSAKTGANDPVTWSGSRQECYDFRTERTSHRETSLCDPLKCHEYRIKKAASFAGRMSEDAIRTILIYAYEIAINIKTGLMDSNMALEYFVAEI